MSRTGFGGELVVGEHVVTVTCGEEWVVLPREEMAGLVEDCMAARADVRGLRRMDRVVGQHELALTICEERADMRTGRWAHLRVGQWGLSLDGFGLSCLAV